MSDLNDRSLQLLKSLVEKYISDGQPVGSRVLSKDTALDLSPATIRNVMADLEDLGLIHSPHTSAGRVPTVTGYRLFVDSLLTVKPIKHQDINAFRSGFGLNPDNVTDIVSNASKLLSNFTKMAGVVMLPRQDSVIFSHIEFLALSDRRVLVVYVTNQQEVHNQIIHTSREFESAELQQVANYLNSVFEGRPLSAVREALIKGLDDDHEQINLALQDVVAMAKEAIHKEHAEEDCIISGETNLMGFSELSDMNNLKGLFDAFSQKRSVIHLLDQCLSSDGVQIFIGEESGYKVFDRCSLVTSSYSVNDEVVGVLGVIGPTRMAYEKVIPFVDVTAKLLGSVLNQKSSSPS
ncbi:MAG: heat-inducible transcriptional repressor HrcA [Methylococcales bacterium]